MQIEFAQDESHLFFQFGRRLLTSRKLTGQFPNYEAVLPRDANKTLSLERGELQDALRRVSQLADQRSHAVKFTLTTEGLEISSSSPEYGEAKEIIEKEFKGEPIAIGFNAQYLLDFLAAAADGPISFELKDEQSAGQLRPTRRRNQPLPLRRHAHAHLIGMRASRARLQRSDRWKTSPQTPVFHLPLSGRKCLSAMPAIPL